MHRAGSGPGAQADQMDSPFAASVPFRRVQGWRGGDLEFRWGEWAPRRSRSRFLMARRGAAHRLLIHALFEICDSDQQVTAHFAGVRIGSGIFRLNLEALKGGPQNLKQRSNVTQEQSPDTMFDAEMGETVNFYAINTFVREIGRRFADGLGEGTAGNGNSKRTRASERAIPGGD